MEGSTSRDGPTKRERTKRDGPIFYVGVGASAGGLEAIESLFAAMPDDTGLAFIVVQHLSPDYKSLMVELLSKRTALTVERAEDGLQVLPDHVYLIPPKRNLTLADGRLHLSEQDPGRGVNLPIDIFFRSLADDQGDRAVGIVLSGTGSDGTRGVRAVKEAGGVVLVQSPESAKFDGMPRAAISTGIADFVVPPERMARELAALARHPASAGKDATKVIAEEEGDAFSQVLALIRERGRVDFSGYKPSTVVRRLERRMTINRTERLEDYVDFLRAHPGEVVTLYREMLIGVTRFFRDREAYETLAERWLPDLVADAAGGELRLWVAGCSTGEEAYSLAIVCREAVEAAGAAVDVKIFATDVDRDAILFAGAGTYPASIVEDVPDRYLGRYFSRHGDDYVVARSLREMIVFAQHNLVEEPPFAKIDLISCRNLLIYLQPPLQRKVLSLFNFSLRGGGLLFLGSSETTGDLSDAFEPLHHRYKIYRSRGRRRAHLEEVMALPSATRTAAGAHVTTPRRGEVTTPQERLLERLTRAFSDRYVPLCLVVNENMEVLHVLGDTAGYFRLPAGRPVNDISRMATRALGIPIATAVQKAFKSGEEVRYSGVRVTAEPRGRNGGARAAADAAVEQVDLRVIMLPDDRAQEPLAAVLIEPVDRGEARADRPATELDAGEETRQRIGDLETELQFTRENLQATIEELETANEELQATNEELLASNEELQSTNEELQSVNEELHTVNAEYQSKIVELTELTNDMTNLLDATRIGTLFLDENLEIRKFTPEMERVFRVRRGDEGRPIHHLSHTLVDVDPVMLIRGVHATGEEVETEARTEDGTWYLLRVLPYSVGSDAVSGVVATAIDISERHRTEIELGETTQALEDSEARLEMAFTNASLAWWDWHVPSGSVSASPHKAGMLGYATDEVGATVDDWVALIHPDDHDRAMRAMRAHLEGDAPHYEVVYRLRTREGGYRRFRDIGRIVERTRLGKPVRLMGTVQALADEEEDA